MVIFLLGLVLFLGVHAVRMVAPGWRQGMIATRGEGPWKGIYSLVSAAGLVLLVWGWAVWRGEAPFLWEPPQGLKHLNLVIMAVALVLLAASQLPSGRIAGHVRHPMLVAVMLWAFGHLLANGDLASLLLFGSFLVWAVWNRLDVARRGDAGRSPGPVRNDLLALAIGAGLWAILAFGGHAWLFGVSVLPG